MVLRCFVRSPSSFKISATHNEAVYVSTRSEPSAKILDGQKYAGYGVVLSYHRVSDIEYEGIVASGDAAAFKLYNRND